MASAAAQKYFSSFSPQEQASIQATWAGNPNGMDDWYQAAHEAGAVNATGVRSGYNYGEQQGYNYSQGVTGGSSLQAGQVPSPTQLRQYAREQGWSEDFNRFDDATLKQWISENWDPSAMRFRSNTGGGLVDKPVDSAPGEAPAWGAGGGGGGGGGGGYGGATTGFGGAPSFQYDPFKPPLPGDTTTDPSYLFRLKEGQDALERSASAKGVLRTSGTLKDILDYGQQAASQEYQNIYDRGLSTWGAQYQGQKDAFAPQYGSWETVYGGDLAKYLQKEGNIFGLLNQPVPPYYG